MSRDESFNYVVFRPVRCSIIFDRMFLGWPSFTRLTNICYYKVDSCR